jgi:hypothetical protein
MLRHQSRVRLSPWADIYYLGMRLHAAVLVLELPRSPFPNLPRFARDILSIPAEFTN